jgi:hypothetical protein
MTGMTTWERWKANLAPRDRDERNRYAEYDAACQEPAAPPSCPYDSCHHNHPETEGRPPWAASPQT